MPRPSTFVFFSGCVCRPHVSFCAARTTRQAAAATLSDESGAPPGSSPANSPKNSPMTAQGAGTPLVHACVLFARLRCSRAGKRPPPERVAQNEPCSGVALPPPHHIRFAQANKPTQNTAKMAPKLRIPAWLPWRCCRCPTDRRLMLPANKAARLSAPISANPRTLPAATQAHPQALLPCISP